MHRDDAKSRLGELKRRYDLIVVGGGIHGAALFWEAVSRGLNTLLLDRNDFGSGTSANSLKIIHGGIRYMQQLQVGRVRESSNERNILMRIAPHLVHPLECIMPTYHGFSKSKLALWCGIRAYELLTYDRNRDLDQAKRLSSGKILSKAALRTMVPDLSGEEITGGARWFDAQAFNTERLVLAYIKSATEQGGHAHNYAGVKDCLVEGNKIAGVVGYDALTGTTHHISADVVIDCTGPWAALSPYSLGQTAQVPEHYARAVNILVPRRLADCAVGVKSTDGEARNRLLFIAPWREGSIFGTWYFTHTGTPDALMLSGEAADNIVAEINRVFPSLNLKRSEISLVHLGLLPAGITNQAAGEPLLLDKPVVTDAAHHEGPEGLFGLQGVKYTTARAVAVHTLNRVCRTMRKAVRPSRTHCTPLYGGDIINYRAFLTACRHEYAAQVGSETVNRLVKNYGSNVAAIMNYVSSDACLGESVPGSTGTIKAELAYALDNEMVCTVSDLVMRRTDLGSLQRPASETIDYAVEIMAARKQWDQTVLSSHVDELLAHYPQWPEEPDQPGLKAAI